MSYAGSACDDQSEDGELRHSPTDAKTRQDEVLDFSLSEEDVDTADSLDIKPPQANRLSHAPSSSNSRSKRRDRNREGRSRHGRSDRHREQERGHGHRDKHHRDRSGRDRTRTDYHREYHKDMYRYQETHSGNTSSIVTYKEAKYLEYRRTGEEIPSQVMRYDRKYEKKDQERHEKLRYQEPEKSRRYDEKTRQKSAADQTLDDLRERLLDKKRLKESDKESRRRLRVPEHLDPSSACASVISTAALEQDAEMYVKEIIDLSGANDEGMVNRERKERHHKREEKMEWGREEIVEKKIMDPESEAQELRKEKLLQADREIARQKEQYRLDRERRHQRRLERQEAKRRLQEQQEQQEQLLRKRQRMSGELDQYKDKDLSIVTVSDASTHSTRSRSRSTDSERSISPDHSSRSSSSEPERGHDTVQEDNDVSDDAESTSAGEEQVDLEHVEEQERQDEESDTSEGRLRRSVNRSISRSRSKSPSPKTNGQLNQKSDKEQSNEKPKSPESIPKKIDEGLPAYFPAIQGCRSVEEFQCLNRIEEGTYGVVYRARDKRTEEIVALKRLKMEKEKEGFPITSLREINTLLKGQHPNIVTVREIVVGSNMDKIFIVMDYVEHDLKSLMETMRNRRQVFVPAEVKCLLRQLLGAVAHLHDNWILHRDLKTSNLLLSHKGILKVGDFGLAREYGSPLKAYTPIVVTLWYRAPELLLCCKEYSTPVDMWSVGCIFAEFLLMNALFPGKSEVDQLNRVFKELGTPNERIWPGYNELPAVKKMKFTEYPVSQLRQRFVMLSELGLQLLQKFLTYDPNQRVTAEDALKHPYFSEPPLPIDPAMFPTWPAKSELGHRKAMAASPKPPSGGREYKQLGDGDEDSALGFHMGGSSSGTSLLEARRLAMGAGFSLKF